MLLFFLVQPPLMLAQEAAHSLLLPKAWRGSKAVTVAQTLVTIGLVLLSAELFWASLESCDIDRRGLKEVTGVMAMAAERIRALVA